MQENGNGKEWERNETGITFNQNKKKNTIIEMKNTSELELESESQYVMNTDGNDRANIQEQQD